MIKKYQSKLELIREYSNFNMINSEEVFISKASP